MTGRGSGRRFAAMGADVVGLVLVVVLTRSLGAQTEEWTAPHPMLLTPSRALAMVTAFDRKLAYVPGEVLVRFRSGVTTTGQQRALLSLRSRPAPSDLRWVGERRRAHRSHRTRRHDSGGAAARPARGGVRGAELSLSPERDAQRSGIHRTAVEPHRDRHAARLGHQPRRQGHGDRRGRGHRHYGRGPLVFVPDLEWTGDSKHLRPVRDEPRLQIGADRQPARLRVLGWSGARHGRSRHARRVDDRRGDEQRRWPKRGSRIASS